MDFALSDEHVLFRETVRAFAERELAPAVARYEAAGEFPLALFHRAAGIGLAGLRVPERLGGSDADSLSYVIAVEEIARVWAAMAVVLSVHNGLTCQAIARYGSPEQQARFLPDLAAGAKLGAYALTEPDAGSDAASLRLRAEQRGQEYRLNGTKVFITSGSSADTFIVFARTAAGSRGITALVVERGTAGFAAGPAESKMGIKASETTELSFTDCVVGADNRLGEEGEGFPLALALLDSGRVGIAAQALGMARGAQEAAIAYSAQRQQFGRPIADFQAIQWKLADSATEIEAARLLTYRAAWLKDRGMPFTREASMAKLYASEAAVRVASRSVQVHGGYGYMTEGGVERIFRDARATEIYEGTSEIQRLVIARHLFAGKEHDPYD